MPKRYYLFVIRGTITSATLKLQKNVKSWQSAWNCFWAVPIY